MLIPAGSAPVKAQTHQRRRDKALLIDPASSLESGSAIEVDLYLFQ